MSNLSLSNEQKKASEELLTRIQKGNDKDVNELVTNFPKYKNSFLRFSQGVYSHPLTWWIGLMQLQMQMGLLGAEKQKNASITANRLWQITMPLKSYASALPVLLPIIRYNAKYRKSDILGRVIGGGFTNYASTGGAIGKKYRSRKLSVALSANNFLIASYGAAIKSIAEGNTNIESVIQSILIGRSESLHRSRFSDVNDDSKLSDKEEKLLNSSRATLHEIMALSQLSPPPEPIKEFCLRPQNIDLTGICK